MQFQFSGSNLILVSIFFGDIHRIFFAPQFSFICKIHVSVVFFLVSHINDMHPEVGRWIFQNTNVSLPIESVGTV